MVRENKTGRYIDIAPWPSHVDENGVMHFQKNDSTESKYAKPVKPDVLIFATGYKHLGFPFFDAASSYPETKDANIRQIWKDDDPSIGFIGFARPQIGAIPALTEFQAQLWIMQILGQLPNKLQPENWYRLHARKDARIQHGVDHEGYVYQMALDMGIAPSIWSVLRRGWKVFVAWSIGANYNTKFRLEGPWKWDGAEETMKTELYDVIPRRDVMWGFIMLNALPILLFGTLSLFYFILDIVVAPISAAKKLVGLPGTTAPGKGYIVLDEKTGMEDTRKENKSDTTIEVSEW